MTIDTTTARQLLEQIKNELEFEVIAHPEETIVRGNAMASGDDAFDAQFEAHILADMQWNQWAWCTIEVRGLWNSIEVSEFLGCCCYGCKKDFLADGYFTDMFNRVVEQIAETVERVVVAVDR